MIAHAYTYFNLDPDGSAVSSTLYGAGQVVMDFKPFWEPVLYVMLGVAAIGILIRLLIGR